MNILIVEDDPFNADVVSKMLKHEGFVVDIAENYSSAMNSIDSRIYSLIILDWNLPDRSGYDFLKELRELMYDVQVLMLSANNGIEYKVNALNSGADDYLCKPFSSAELLARVNSLLRRTNSNKNTIIQLGAVSIHKNSKEVQLNGDLVNLTPAEYDLLETLASNPRKTFTKSELLSLVQSDYSSFSMSNIIEVHIKNLRKKLSNKEIIKTVRGTGYKIIS